jgi:uncharacterized delta-60 repeat protein
MKKINRTRLSHFNSFAVKLNVIIAFLFIFLVIAEKASLQSLTYHKANVKTSGNFTISGNVKADNANLAGATISLLGSSSAVTTTDANGNYSLTVAGGNYTVSVYKNGFAFNPASRAFSNVQSNQTANFQNGTPLCSPPPANLVAWYFGNNSAQDLVTGNFGTTPNGISYTSGKVGLAFSLTSPNYISAVNSPALNAKQELTLSGWFKFDSVPSENHLISKPLRNNINNSYALYFAGGQLRGGIGNATSFDSLETTFTPNVGVWYHIAYTFNDDADLHKIYVNGAEIASEITNAEPFYETDFHPVLLGADLQNNEVTFFHHGQIDEAQIYNQALSISDIQSIFTSGSTGGCSISNSVATGPGTLDASFGSFGKVITQVSGNDNAANAVAIQPDGKIIAAGYNAGTNGNSFAVVRYNQDGSPDNSFGTNGLVLTSFGVQSEAKGVALQPDGKIVAAGYSYTGSNNDFVLARYNSDGSLDPAFGNDGKVITPSVTDDYARSMAIEPDGKIIVAGQSRNPAIDFAMVRYNADGSVDNAFGLNGKVITDFNNSEDDANSVKIQDDGKIVVGGYSRAGSSTQFALARYNTNGSLDTTFGATGKITTSVGGNFYDSINSVAIQPDGKIIAAGYASAALDGGLTNINFALVRYQTNGDLDSSFGTGGKAITRVGTFSSAATSIAIQSDNKIVIAGNASINIVPAFATPNFALARYNSNGLLDLSFGVGGKAITPISGSSNGANALAIQSDNKIVAVGQISTGSGTASRFRFALARYNSNLTNINVPVNLKLYFSNVTQSGNTYANPLAVSQIPALPGGFELPNNAAIYDIQTSAGYAGSVKVEFTLPNVSSQKVCNGLQLLHFENGAWSVTGNQTPQYNAATQNCTVSQNVNSLSLFAVAHAFNKSNAFIDFDGDGKTDISIFRPSDGSWWYTRSSAGDFRVFTFGTGSDIIAPGDFTGDGKTDLAIFRPSSGEWFIRRSEDNSFFSFPFGSAGDTPVPADFDGDGKTDVAVFRPSAGTWYVLNSNGSGTSIVQFGSSEDKPVPADFDGDGKADIAIFRPSDGSWWYLRSSDGAFRVYRFGLGTDKPVQGDYTGDGKADIAVFRPSTGEWFFQRSEDNSYYSVPFGTLGDVATPGDYDGDGKFDTAVFRPATANWFVQRSTTGILITNFGATGDRPIPNAFVP